MRQFDFYEFTGTLAPGTLTLLGLGVLYAPLWQLLNDRALSVGDLALFLILAYITGHLTQAIGNVLEAGWWWIWGGRPALWAKRGNKYLLAPPQVIMFHEALRQKLGLDIESMRKLNDSQMAGITRQIYAAVSLAGMAGRVDVFNGNYGICRGIAAALLIVLVVLTIGSGLHYWNIQLGLVFCIALALYRMDRFAKHYARELYAQFLQMNTDLEPVNED